MFEKYLCVPWHQNLQKTQCVALLDFGRAVNLILTWGADYAHHITAYHFPPLPLQIFRPSYGPELTPTGPSLDMSVVDPRGGGGSMTLVEEYSHLVYKI